jgi:hypothetical protein
LFWEDGVWLLGSRKAKEQVFLKIETDCSSQKQREKQRENGFEEREREKERESLTFHTKQLFSIRNRER